MDISLRCRWIPARRISIDEIGELFHEAYNKAATIENAAAGFRSCGIYPLNRDILPDNDYLKDPRNENVSESQDQQIAMANVPANPAERIATAANNVANSPAPTTPVEMITSGINSETSYVDFNSSLNTSVSFTDILPVPKIPAKVSKRKGEVSEILTSSPYKKTLLAKLQTQKDATKKKCTVKIGRKINKQNATKSTLKKHTQRKKSKATTKATAACVDQDTENIQSNEEDWECVVCGGMWSRSVPGEDWIKGIYMVAKPPCSI